MVSIGWYLGSLLKGVRGCSEHAFFGALQAARPSETNGARSRLKRLFVAGNVQATTKYQCHATVDCRHLQISVYTYEHTSMCIHFILCEYVYIYIM